MSVIDSVEMTNCPNCGTPNCNSECVLIDTGQPSRDRLKRLRDKLLPPAPWSDRRKFLMDGGRNVAIGLLILALNRTLGPQLPPPPQLQAKSELTLSAKGGLAPTGEVAIVKIRAGDNVSVQGQEQPPVLVATATATNATTNQINSDYREPAS